MTQFERASREAGPDSGRAKGAPDGWRKVTSGLIEADQRAEEGARLSSDRTRCIVAVKRVGAQIGLKAADVLLLDTLTAFTQAQDWEEGQRPIVWASNAYLMERTGFSLSTLKRHARRLAETGVITFRDSPNGKRWGRRDPDGVIVEAYGFDLSPLSARVEEFEALARDLAEERAMCQRLRRQITIARRNIRARLEAYAGRACLAHMWETFDALLQGLPGPRATSEVLSRLFQRFSELLTRVERALCPVEDSEHCVSKAKKVNPSEANSDSHIRITNQKLSVVRSSSENEERGTDATYDRPHAQAVIEEGQAIGIDLRIVVQACPEFVLWGRNLNVDIHDWRDFTRVADALRSMVGVSEDAWTTAQAQLGKSVAAAALALVFEKVHAGEVSSPGGYLRGMVAKAQAGELHLARSFFGRLNADAARLPV